MQADVKVFLQSRVSTVVVELSNVLHPPFTIRLYAPHCCCTHDGGRVTLQNVINIYMGRRPGGVVELSIKPRRCMSVKFRLKFQVIAEKTAKKS